MRLVDMIQVYIDGSSQRKAMQEFPATTEELPLLPRDWPDEWQEMYVERAAIMEFDGGLSRQEAEHRAEEIICAVYRRRQCKGQHDLEDA